MAVRIAESDFEEQVLNVKVPVFVEFYSDSCIPCKKMNAVLGDLEDKYAGSVAIKKVNVNFVESLGEQYQILSAPTTILFYQGKEQYRITGVVKKEELVELLKKII